MGDTNLNARSESFPDLAFEAGQDLVLALPHGPRTTNLGEQILREITEKKWQGPLPDAESKFRMMEFGFVGQ